MSTEPAAQVSEVRQRPPIPAIVRFLLAVVLVVIANTVLPVLCFSAFGNHVVVADTVYRWLASAVLIAGFLFFSRVLDQVETDAWTYIGLPLRKDVLRDVVLGLAFGAVLVAVGVIAIAVGGELEFHLTLSGRAVQHAVTVLILLLGGALLEELMFRGYPFQRLIESIGAPGAILVLSAFFGAVHLGNPNAGGIRSWGFFNTLAVGVLFAVAYLRTRSLWLPVGIHFSWNFVLGVVFGLPVSGIKDFAVIVHATARGSKLLTGGAYGIEASLTGFILILLGILAIGLLPQRFLASDKRRPMVSGI